ncbi:MAG: thiol-activated cytolysin family protein [Clostridiales bacterium]|jgi:hypothetical protein|nr:thiol-activated cytolysin family protein [Clostridiales bacterium]
MAKRKWLGLLAFSLILVVMFAACKPKGNNNGGGTTGGGEGENNGNNTEEGNTPDYGINDYLADRQVNNVAESYLTDLDFARNEVESYTGQAAIDEAANNGDPFTYNALSGYEFTYQKYKTSMGISDIVSWGANDQIIYAGNLFKIGDTSGKETLTQITGLPRASGKISIGLEGAPGTGVKSYSMGNDISLSSYRDGVSYLVGQNIVQGATIPPRYVAKFVEIKNEQEFDLAVGASVSGGIGGFSASVKATFDFNQKTHDTYALFMLTQIFYTIDFDYPTNLGAMGFFEAGTTADRIKSVIKTGDIPAYVSSVAYGRTIVMTLKSNSSYQEIKTAVNASVSYGPVDSKVELNKSLKETLQNTELNYFVYGGKSTGQISQDSIQYELDNFEASDCAGLPIAYKLAYLDDGSLAKIGITSEYYVKNVTPITVKTLRFATQRETLSTAQWGTKIKLNADINPTTATAFDIKYSLIGNNTDIINELWTVAYDANFRYIAEIKREGNDWYLIINPYASGLGEIITIFAEVDTDNDAYKCEYELKITIKTEEHQVTFVNSAWEYVRGADECGKVADDAISSVEAMLTIPEGLEFAGWFTEPEFIHQFTNTSYVVTENIRLYVKFSSNNATIEYKNYHEENQGVGHGTDGKSEIMHYQTGATIGLLPEPPEMMGKTFVAYYWDEDFVTPVSIHDVVIEKVNVVYIKWTPIKTKVTFNSNTPSGYTLSGSMDSVYFTYGETITLPALKYSVAEHLFMGWSTDGSTYSDKQNIGVWEKVATDITLYAVWAKSHLHWQETDKKKITSIGQHGLECTVIDTINVSQFAVFVQKGGYKFIFYIYVVVSEIQNGTQAVYLYSKNTTITKEVSLGYTWDYTMATLGGLGFDYFQHGPGKLDTNIYQHDLYIEIDGAKMPQTNLYIRYDAWDDGAAQSNNWYRHAIYVEIYAVKK